MKKLFKIFEVFRKTYTANVCKHKTHIKGRIHSLGESFTMKIPLSENGKPDYYLDCIANMSIRCAWCGEPIHIGEPITLYIPQEGYKIPDYAISYGDGLVGCLGYDCGEALFRAGFWFPPGKVFRVLSPFEMCTTSNKAVIVSDISDPNNIGKVL